MVCLSCEAALCFASPSLRQAEQAHSFVDGRAGCAGANCAVVILVMCFSEYYSVLTCEVQRGYEGVRVTGRREISALEGTDLSWVLEECSLCVCCMPTGFGGKIEELPW